MDEAKRAQRLEKRQLAAVELHELLVAREHVGEPARHPGAVARKQHPQILHRRAHARVVEVHEMRAIVRPQDVSGVAIAVKTQDLYLSAFVITTLYCVKSLLRRSFPRLQQVRRNEAALEQHLARHGAERFGRQRLAMLERLGGAARMD